MIKITEGRICELCGKNEAVVICNGCAKESIWPRHLRRKLLFP